jgi:NAD(P)H-hydrate repair Nnr-like enzyme with NAD(P)H-hydrate dehydratase domain
MAVDQGFGEPNADAASGGSGDALSSIINSISGLGEAAIQSFGPQNQGLATNPYGQQARYTSGGALINPATGMPYSTGTSATSILLFAGVALLAIFAYTKL